MPPPPEKLLVMFAANTAMFAAVALVLWGVEAAWARFVARSKDSASRWKSEAEGRGKRRESQSIPAALLFALRNIPWMLGGALGLSILATVAAKLLGLELPSQDLIAWLTGDAYSAKTKAAIIAFAVLEAPVLEEILFRRFIFRALYRRLPIFPAMLISGCAFALAHSNALVFIPLVFLGSAFAWLYWRTGRIIAPMFAHFLFNAVNVALLLAFPQLG